VNPVTQTARITTPSMKQSRKVWSPR
jgi:hypothetical protein